VNWRNSSRLASDSPTVSPIRARRFALQDEHTEDALGDPVERFAADEPFQATPSQLAPSHTESA